MSPKCFFFMVQICMSSFNHAFIIFNLPFPHFPNGKTKVAAYCQTNYHLLLLHCLLYFGCIIILIEVIVTVRSGANCPTFDQHNLVPQSEYKCKLGLDKVSHTGGGQFDEKKKNK